MQQLKNIGRPKEFILVLFQITSFFLFAWALFQNFSIGWWALALFGYFLIFGLGITVAFHRLMAHRSFELWKPLEYLFALFANLGCTGSSVGWIFVHRAHHKFSDKQGDPHSPAVYGRIGAMIGQYGGQFDKWVVRDIIANPTHQFYHNYYHLIIISLALALCSIKFELFLFLYAIPVFLNTIASRMSNWIDHESSFGKRNFATRDLSHNVWWWSLLTFGEGWHNNHHGQPWNYKFGQKWYEIDVGRYVVEFLHLIGLAKIKNLKDLDNTNRLTRET